MNDQLPSTEQLIYLDIDFISSFYDSYSKDSIPISISKTQGRQGNFSFGIAGVNAQTIETKQYSISSSEMFNRMFDKLSTFPPLQNKPEKSTEFYWLEGELRAHTLHNSTERNGQILYSEISRYFS